MGNIKSQKDLENTLKKGIKNNPIYGDYISLKVSAPATPSYPISFLSIN